MKKYESPTLNLTLLEASDILTISFGSLPELDDDGTNTPTTNLPILNNSDNGSTGNESN